MLGLKSKFLLQQYDGSKFGGIVFYIEAVLLTLDDGMTSTDTYVVDPNLALVAPSKFELRLFGSNR